MSTVPTTATATTVPPTAPITTTAPVRNPAIVRGEAVMAAKRRSALRTLWLPIAGTGVAAVSAFFLPVTALDLGLLLGMFVLVTVGMEVGVHRLVSHKAFQTSKPVLAVLWVMGLMAGQGSGVYWAATHRRHHAHSDTAFDAHSPHVREGIGRLSRLRGLWHSHQGHTYTDPATNVAKFAPDLVRHAMLQRLDRLYPWWVTLGLVIPAVIGGLVTGTWAGAWNGFLWGGPVRIFVQHQLFFTNASIAHAYGERRFDTGDESRNNWLCAIWTFGSALQNTHHAFASSAFTRQRWYELDLAGAVIRAMELTGLAWDVRRPTPEQLAAKRLRPAPQLAD